MTTRDRLNEARVEYLQIKGSKGFNRFIEGKIRKQVLPERVVQLYPRISLTLNNLRTYLPARSYVSESKGCESTSLHPCIRDQTSDTGRTVVPRRTIICASLYIFN